MLVVLHLVTLLSGPVTRSLVMPGLRPAVAAGALLAAAAATSALGERRWLLRWLVIVALTAGVAVAEGPLLGAWSGASLAVADWGVRGWRPVPAGHRPAPQAALVVAVIAALAAWRGADTAAGLWPLVVLAAAVVVLTAGLAAGDALDRGVRAAAGAIGRVLSLVLFVLLALPVVVVPWLVRRLAGFDELEPSRRRGSAWLRRTPRPVRAAHPWTTDGLADRPPVGPRLRVAALWLGIGVAVVWAVGSDGVRGLPLPTGDEGAGASWWSEPDEIPPAYEDAEWYEEYREDIEWVMDQDAAFRPLHRLRVADVSTRHVNVADGVRRTWQPPCEGCDPLVVWLYGGSTIFGIGQRDDHTIPSELARVAWEEGIALEVVNRGVPGDLHWDEAVRLQWDLAVEEPPDLVLFYDGANELWAARTMNDRRMPDDTGPVEPLLEQFWDGVEEVRDRTPEAPDGGRLVPSSTVPQRTPEEIGAEAARRYEIARKVSSRAVGDLPARWFWQPTTASRGPVEGEPRHADGGENARATYEAARRDLAPGVVDLGDVLDGIERPLFSDDVHHNEEAARAIAAAIFGAIRHDLVRLGGR